MSHPQEYNYHLYAPGAPGRQPTYSNLRAEQNLSSKSQCQLSASTKRTNPIYQRTIYLFVHPTLLGPCNTTPAHHAWGRGVGVTCSAPPRPTSAHTPNMEHIVSASSRHPCPLPPPAKRPHQNAAPTPRKTLYCCPAAPNVLST